MRLWGKTVVLRPLQANLQGARQGWNTSAFYGNFVANYLPFLGKFGISWLQSQVNILI
jgi:hypothetical protein